MKTPIEVKIMISVLKKMWYDYARKYVKASIEYFKSYDNPYTKDIYLSDAMRIKSQITLLNWVLNKRRP